MSRRTKITIAAIIALSALLRFYALDRIPDGIYPDEAINGIEGLEAAETGQFKLFYPTNNGREGLWINLVGFAVRAFGNNHFALRFWAALFGTVTVWGSGLLARKLFGSIRIGLLTAFFVATSFWHLNFSRIAFSGILVPLLMVWSFYFLLNAWDRPKTKEGAAYAILAGVLFGLGFHTYSPFRFAPFVWIVLFGLIYLQRRKDGVPLRPFLVTTAFWLAAAFLAGLPMGIYFWTHPEDFSGRANMVSIFATDEPLQTFKQVLVQTLGMFNIRGDCNWRHNMSCSPQLIFPVGFAFLVGIGRGVGSIVGRTGRSKKTAGKRLTKNRAFPKSKESDLVQSPAPIDAKLVSYFLFAWTAFLLAPELLTFEGIPHALRAIGVIPPVLMLAAFGADAIYEKLKGHSFLRVTVLIIVVGSGIVEAYRYFGVWAVTIDTKVIDAFMEQDVEIVRHLKSHGPSTPKYVFVNVVDPVMVPHKNPDGSTKLFPWDVQTVIYLTLKDSSVTYLALEDFVNYVFPKGSVIVPYARDPEVFRFLRQKGMKISEQEFPYFTAGIVE